MQNRTPVPRSERDLDLSFTPVPRKYRHDGWTPERQQAFVEALADTGCVKVSCRMVNMSWEGAYQLRRMKGAESFRRAWEAALSFGAQRLKDEAFERAINGELIPVFHAGKLMGFRRKKNDRLLMFCLKHWGQDSNGRRVTVNYFSSKASAGAAAGSGAGGGEAGAAAEASTTTIRTVTSGGAAGGGSAARMERDDAAADILNAFEGAELDAEAQAQILSALEACAERRRLADPDNHEHLADRLAAQEADVECDFIRVPNGSLEYMGELESGYTGEEFVPFTDGEGPWESCGQPVPEWFQQFTRDQQAKREAMGEQGEEKKLPGQPAPEDEEGDRTDGTGFTPVTAPSSAAPPDPDDPRLDWQNWESGEYVAPQ